MVFDFSALVEQRHAIASGVATTMSLSLSSVVISLVAGLLVALGQRSGIRLLDYLLGAYIQLFRNTPLLIQIYFFYKALPFAGIYLDPFLCGMLALSLQTTAYMAEIYRSGFEAVPKAQVESGLALGMTRVQTNLTIILPQAIGIIMPPLGNQIIGVIKNSSLVAFITVADLFFVVYEQSVTHFRYLEFFTVGILLYMAMTIGTSWVLFGLEDWLLRRLTGQPSRAWLARPATICASEVV
ncbi:MAG: amino acid ABC transporter permease [Cyanobacteria bacterium HKST-UBA04]|nr:amino acid ABC transporter permease [Cyanobacteria bacterium HKST-UBA04]MCA9842430.1 amino acid ABC transporter permease [Cyanobacteria bacterium HKST-UBA03]